MPVNKWEWVAINQNIDDSSLALPLIDFATADEFAPIPSAPGAEQLTSGGMAWSDSNVDASFSVGLFGLAASAHAEWQTRSWDLKIFNDVPSAAAGKVPLSIRWGSGFHLHIQHEAVNTSISYDNSASQLGLAVEAGLT